MIAIYDEALHLAETGKLLPIDTPVHLLHFLDHYPFCWDMGRTGAYAGTRDDVEVTCEDCLRYMANF